MKYSSQTSIDLLKCSQFTLIEILTRLVFFYSIPAQTEAIKKNKTANMILPIY